MYTYKQCEETTKDM